MTHTKKLDPHYPYCRFCRFSHRTTEAEQCTEGGRRRACRDANKRNCCPHYCPTWARVLAHSKRLDLSRTYW